MGTHNSLLPQDASFSDAEQKIFEQLVVEAEIDAIVNALFTEDLLVPKR
jgi:hypothetical protein